MGDMEERVRKALSPLGIEPLELVDSLVVPTPRPGVDGSFFEGFALRGIRVDRIEPGFLSCSFTVPPRQTDRNGNFSTGAIANLVDEVGGAVVLTEGDGDVKVSVDMSISYLANATLNDELEITGKLLGQKGGYAGTVVVLRKKTTGEVVAEGRHSLFGSLRSKI